jgi:deazaflavin-dependent oxidoreductase (nitroreductase family)
MTNPTTAPSFVSALNPLVRRLLHIGMPMGPNVLLTVRGRTSGQPRTFPIAILQSGGHEYVASPFGEVNWVHNLRADGRAVLRRGRREQPVVAAELTADEAGRVFSASLGRYLALPIASSLLRRFYKLPAQPSAADYLREAQAHPMFELRPMVSPAPLG